MLPYPTTVISVYIPPHSPISQTQAVTHHIKDLAATCQNIIIMGDLNHPEIDWATLTGNSDSGSLVCDCFFQLNLTQIIHDPTHIRGNTLDIIASNHPQLLTDLSINTSTESIASDHYIITFSFNITNITQPDPKKTLWLYQNANISIIQSYLQAIHITISQNDVNLAWQHISNLLLQVKSKFVPKITVSRNSPKWFNADIRHNLNRVHTLRRLNKKKPSASRQSRLEQEET